MKNFIKFLESFKPNTSGLPKELGSWVERKYDEINKAIELWKTPSKAIKTVVKPTRLVLAGAAGAGTYKLIKWFETKKDVIAKFFESNPDKESIIVSGDLENFTDKDLLNAIIDENPKLFKSGFKPKMFKVIMVKKNNKMYPQYYIIDGVKYSPVDLTKGLEVKMIK
jgi:hypothetical protein